MHGIFYSLTEHFFVGRFDSHIYRLVKLVCSMHVEELFPVVYVSADGFLTGFDQRRSLPLNDFLL